MSALMSIIQQQCNFEDMKFLFLVHSALILITLLLVGRHLEVPFCGTSCCMQVLWHIMLHAGLWFRFVAHHAACRSVMAVPEKAYVRNF